MAGFLALSIAYGAETIEGWHLKEASVTVELVSLLCLVVLGTCLCATVRADVPPLPEKVEPYPVVADIAFAEGPIFDRAGNLYFVNYHVLGTLGRRTPDGTVSGMYTGQANGPRQTASVTSSSPTTGEAQSPAPTPSRGRSRC
jgi:hypothetical protein